MKKRIGLIFGGKSSEHEVSLMSAASVLKAIDKEKYEVVQIAISKTGSWYLCDAEPDEIEKGAWARTAMPFSVGDLQSRIDFALPILHGAFGEDGTIQGLFEMLDIPYAGCGVLASAACMDKIVAKALFEKAGIPTCKYLSLDAEKAKSLDKDLIAEELGYPVFVKPANAGSSVGISKVKNEAELDKAIELAAQNDRRIIIEEEIVGRELEIGMIGNADLTASAIGEIVAANEFYDYESKYQNSETRLSIPAELTKDQRRKLEALAKKAYKACDCAGFARCDFFMDNESGEILINEINTIPGFTNFSMVPLLFAEAGIPYSELIEKIIDLGYERYNAKNNG